MTKSVQTRENMLKLAELKAQKGVSVCPWSIRDLSRDAKRNRSGVSPLNQSRELI